MKAHDLIKALEDGKSIKLLKGIRPYNPDSERSIYNLESFTRDFSLKYIFEHSNNFEIVKEKVKYYPALLQCDLTKKYFITDKKYSGCFNGCVEVLSSICMTNVTYIRLVKEIPELIEERDE